jgi:ABC-type transport system involved in multi-copper enzyme maturation permease subunit
MRTLTDTWIVFGAELRRALKSPRVLIVLLLYLAFSAGVMLASGALARQAHAQFEAQGQDAAAMISPKAGLLAMLFGQDRALIESLLQLPAMLLVVFKLGLVFLPAYVALLGFDAVSGELQTRSLRYLSVRTSRTALALGKGLALAAVVLLLVTVVHLGSFGYATSTLPDFSFGDAARIWPRLWGTSALVGVGMAALTILCSTLSRAPALSLTLNFAALLGFWAAGAVGDGARMVRMVQNQTEVSWQERIGLLAPSTWSAELLYPDPSRVLTGLLALLAFTLICTSAAVTVLRWRDL